MTAHIHQARVFRLSSGRWSWSYTLPESLVESPDSFPTPYAALTVLYSVLPRPYSLLCEHDPHYVFLGAAMSHIISVNLGRVSS